MNCIAEVLPTRIYYASASPANSSIQGCTRLHIDMNFSPDNKSLYSNTFGFEMEFITDLVLRKAPRTDLFEDPLLSFFLNSDRSFLV